MLRNTNDPAQTFIPMETNVKIKKLAHFEISPSSSYVVLGHPGENKHNQKLDCMLYLTNILSPRLYDLSY